MKETLYLVLEKSRKRWRGVRISRVSKNRPILPRPSEQALVRLVVDLPDRALEPTEIKVEIRPEHLTRPPIQVQVEKP